jgi:hypothetical protein
MREYEKRKEKKEKEELHYTLYTITTDTTTTTLSLLDILLSSFNEKELIRHHNNKSLNHPISVTTE